MTDEEFDAMMARAANPNLIPGIYNYCDRRCERCRFADRCFSYLESRKEPEPSESVGTMMERSLEGTLDVLRIIAERQGIDLFGTAEETAILDKEEEASEQRALTDPI